MIECNGPNERVKRRYLHELKEKEGRDEASLDAVAKAIDRFEKYSKHRDFKRGARVQNASRGRAQCENR
jgi:integrase/recombinase XerD